MGIEVFPVPASGPSLAEITSAITTNAAPASVTMPAITSSITTNAAPASVTMAAITSSITTNAASSGVTMAAINTAVANNASPFGGTWTNIGTTTSASQTVTVSSLSSYKYLRFTVNVNCTSGQYGIPIRFNNDANNNYYFNAFSVGSASQAGQASVFRKAASSFDVATAAEINGSTETSLILEIFSAQTAAPKTFRATYVYSNASNYTVSFVTEGTWTNTSAISNVVFSTSRSSGNSWTIITQGAS